MFFDFVFEISETYPDLPEDGEDFMKNRSKSAGAIMKQVDFMVMMDLRVQTLHQTS